MSVWVEAIQGLFVMGLCIISYALGSYFQRKDLERAWRMVEDAEAALDSKWSRLIENRAEFALEVRKWGDTVSQTLSRSKEQKSKSEKS